MIKNQAAPKYHYIQSLRGISACLVVLFHTNAIGPLYGKTDSLFARLMGGFGQAGVDIFFIISGFIITVSTTQPQSKSNFLKRRFIRIAPLYWFFTTVFLGTYFLKPDLFSSFHLNSWHALASFLFIPALGPSGKISPVIGYGWSLNYEMLFYLIFVLVLTANPFHRLAFAVGVYTLLAATNTMIPESAVNLKAISTFYSDPIFVEFLFGMFIGACTLRYKHHLTKILSVSTLIAITSLFILRNSGLSSQRIVHFGLPAVIIFSLFLLLDVHSKWKAPGTYLGDISYSTYLVQTFSLTIYWKFLTITNVMTFLDSTFVAITSVAVTLVTAHISYLIVETKSSKWLRKLLRV